MDDVVLKCIGLLILEAAVVSAAYAAGEEIAYFFKKRRFGKRIPAIYNLVVDGKVVASSSQKAYLKKFRDDKYPKANCYVERNERHPRGASKHSGNPYLGFQVKFSSA